MATRFEIVLWGDDPARLRAAGEEALAEVRRIERQLSRFLPDSDVARVNAAAGRRPVRVDPRVARLLAEGLALSRKTEGAFDMTVGPLVRLWREAGERGVPPAPDEIARARGLAGSDGLEVEAAVVHLRRPGMLLDLGAFGKGHALDVAYEVLEEAGVSSAILHGGTSSVRVLGVPEGGGTWRIGWRIPTEQVPRAVDLRPGTALGVSAPHGRMRFVAGRPVGHVIDPRSGQPVAAALSARVSGPAAAACDALSTALLVLGEAGTSLLRERLPGYQGQVAAGAPIGEAE